MRRLGLAAWVLLVACRSKDPAAPQEAGPPERDAAASAIDAVGLDAPLADVVIADAAIAEQPIADLADVATLPDLPPGAAPDGPADAAPDGPADAPPDGPAPPPPRIFLTVNELPDYLNGSRPYSLRGDSTPHPFRVRVNRADFTLDVTATGGDWSQLAARCDQPLVLPGGHSIDAGAPFGGSMFVPAGADSRQLHFTGSALPHDVTVTCRATIVGPGGVAESALTFLAATLPPELDPFPQPDRWLVVLSRDLFRLEVTAQPGGTKLVSSVHVPGGNGAVDLDEPLFELGLLSLRSPATGALVKARLLEEVRRQAHRIFGLDRDGKSGKDGARLELFFEGDPGAPAAADFATGTFSMIALGGDGTPEDQASKLVGQADLDGNNRRKNDNTAYGRGVFVTALVRQILSNPLSLLLLSEILPGRGTPIGDHPGDARFLAPGFDPATADPTTRRRAELYATVHRLLAVGLGSTLCHEIGHSLGLVPSGPPPLGMFAELPGLDFTVQDVAGAHIDTPGLNVEQTGAVTSWADALNEEPRWNALSMAYLRRRLVVGRP